MPERHHLSQADYEKALAASAVRPKPPWAVESVEFDSVSRNMILRFPGGVGLSVPVVFITELTRLKTADLKRVYLSPSGETLCLDSADVHVSTRGLINEVFAQLPKEVAASRMGAVGGGSTSPAKRLSSAENGKKGGRPRKALSTRSASEPA